MPGIIYRQALAADVLKLSILYKTVYIQTYGTEGVSDEFANFIMKQFAPERLAEIIANDPDRITVAEYRNNLVGVAELEFEKASPVGNIVAPELNKLYLLEWFCGKGIGYGLLNQAEQIVRSKGIREIWLWVLSANTRAVSFYERQRYRTIGKAFFQMEQNRYENDVMVKQLVADH